jgi:hypothetical protein
MDGGAHAHEGLFRVPFGEAVRSSAQASDALAGDIEGAAEWLRTCGTAWTSLTQDCGQPCFGDFSLVLQVLVMDNGNVYVGDPPSGGQFRVSYTRAMANAVVREGVHGLQRRAAGTPAGTITPLVTHGLVQALVGDTHTHNAAMLPALLRIARGETPQGADAPPLVLRVSLRPMSALRLAKRADGSPHLVFATTHANALVLFPRCAVVVEPTLRKPIRPLVEWLQLATSVRVVGVGPSLRCPAADLPLCTSIAAVVTLALVANVAPQHRATHTSQAHLQAVCDWAHARLHWFLRLLVIAYQATQCTP